MIFILPEEKLKLIEKAKKKWAEIFEVSASGTLAHSESVFILKTLEDIESDLENFEILNDEELELVTGGKDNLTKSLAAILALTAMCMSSPSSGITSVSAGIVDTTKRTVKSVAKKVKKVCEDYPIIAKTASTAFIIGAFVAGDKISEKIYLRDAITEIDSFSDRQVEELLREQIEMYKNINSNIFDIKSEIIQKAHPRTLLIIMLRLNLLFYEHPTLTNALIENRLASNKKFTLGICNDKNNVASANLDGVNFSEFWISCFKELLLHNKRAVKSKFYSPIEMNKLIDDIIVHEMGHILQFLIIYKNHSHHSPDEQFFQMKTKILKIARERYGNTNETISKYGEKDNAEFWAEAFAHWKCSKEENLNPIGKAMRDCLNELFENDLRFR